MVNCLRSWCPSLLVGPGEPRDVYNLVFYAIREREEESDNTGTDTAERPSLKAQLETLYAKEKELEKEKARIYRLSLAAPEDQKVCEDSMAEEMVEMIGAHERRFIQFPITVMGIDTNPTPTKHRVNAHRKLVGSWVAIRPCSPEYKTRTFLGLYVGDLPLGASASFNQESGVLAVFQTMHNPAIFVPELKRIVYGCESWWGALKTPEDLKQITDADIESTWYLQALKSLTREQ